MIFPVPMQPIPPPLNFSNGPSLKKNYYYIFTLTVYCIFFPQLAFCQLKTLQMLNTSRMYICASSLTIC